MMLVLLACFSQSPSAPEAPPAAPPTAAPVAPPEATPPAVVSPPATPPADAPPAPPPTEAPPVAPTAPPDAATAPSSPTTPPTADATASVAPVDPAIQARVDAAKKVVDDIYALYQKEDNPPESNTWFSRGLKSQYKQVEQYESTHDTLIFDFDPVINGQDWDIQGVKTVATPQGENVQVVATFKNSGKPEKITYTMVLEGTTWKIDNIRGGKWDLRKLLRVPKGG